MDILVWLSQDETAFLGDRMLGKHLYVFSILLLKDKQKDS